ncbi:BglG family transcription antiterminator [Anaerococcus sp. DFU013_CI05]|uniref:BglG family transcription antiterminator n=1 Tax=Anaerococcus sp. AH8042_DFU013_CI05 TaxID=3385202 RepID=UPI003A520B09
MWESLDDRKTLMLSALEKSNVSIIDLSNALSVSEKTIKNEIQVLNHELKDGAYIYIKNGVISLFIYNFDIYNSIKKKNVVSSTDFTNLKIRILYIVKRLLNEKKLQLDQLADEMNISKSTLTKDIKLANEGLSSYQLNIYGKPNVGINLIGAELDKRYFILENGYDYMLDNSKFDDQYNEFLQKLLVSFFINEDTCKGVTRFFHTTMYRIRNGNFLIKESKDYSFYENKEYMDISYQIKDFVIKLEEIELSDTELNFILIPLMGMRTSSHLKDSFNSAQLDEIRILTNKIFERIKTQMDINVDLGEITENFNYHIYYLLNRISLNYNIKNPLSENIKNEYKVAYKMSDIASDVIFEQKKKLINESEKSYLASYFQIYLFDKLNSSPINKFKVGIINKNKDEAVQIIPLVQERFSNINAIDYFEDTSQLNLKENYDLIISSQAVNLENALFLPDGFKNKKLIQKELDNFYFKQNIFRKERALKSLIFTELREETLFIGNYNEYETNLVKMLEYLENKKIIDVEFTNSILLRETQSSTKFSDKVAFPHIKNEKFILSMGIFPNSDIKVIFIVGVPNDDDTLIINLYDEIVSVSSDSDFLNHVEKVENYRELMEVIIKETELFR